jgi:hypothetical protein
MKNKKISKYLNEKRAVSWFSEHVMNIVVAIGCIIILLFVGVKMYGLFSEKTELEKAEGNLKLIKERIELLKNSPETNSMEIIVYPPKNWVLRSYIDAFPLAECYSQQGCLCLCQDGTCANNVPKICYGFDYKVEIPQSFAVPRAWYNPGRIVSSPTTYNNAIGFLKAAEGLKVYKSDNKILIEQK